MTPHRDQQTWQHLRKDKKSALVVLLVIAAGLAALLAVISLLLGPSRAPDRLNPLYWALLLPFAWWAAALANYARWAVSALRPAAAIAGLTAVVSLLLASSSHQHLTAWIVAAIVAVPCATIGAVLYPTTLLAQR